MEPGRSAHLMAMAGHDPVVFFTYRADLPQARGTSPRTRPVAALRAVYGDFHGLMPEILALVAGAGATHADTVGQIHLERWSRGRVVLLGDSAWCPTPYSGYGSALALTGGESLGRHLTVTDGEAPDVPAALRAWEAECRPGTDVARTAARRARHFFLPDNRLVTAVRQAALRTLSQPWAARLLRALPRGEGVPAGPIGFSTRTFTRRSPARPAAGGASLRKLSLDRAWRGADYSGLSGRRGRVRGHARTTRRVHARREARRAARRCPHCERTRSTPHEAR
ncbi:MAG TPA: hypothetical protein VGH76_24980 [Actinomycetospora sp.]|uniref:hypothetical protein n=1 Tax=Actinomycetospora sp. TaxID=1872135 RepID=UPI002F41BD70